MEEDPEKQRIDELVAKVGRQEASDAEREELALYAADNPEIEHRLTAEAESARLGRGWLERVEADRRLKNREATRFIKVERGVGLALVIGGTALGFVGSIAGPIAVMGGIGLLAWSFARTRLATYKDDPYKDIKE